VRYASVHRAFRDVNSFMEELKLILESRARESQEP
jgi:transcriptional regulator NrdR family protein